MLDRFRKFFDERIGAPGAEQREMADKRVRLAAAALLIEVARADFEIARPELAQIAASLRSLFVLDEETTATLMELADSELRDATCLHAFTSLINRHWSASDKLRIIEQMWSVALADAVVDPHERHLLRKVGSLLYIPHEDYVAARLRVRSTLDPRHEHSH